MLIKRPGDIREEVEGLLGRISINADSLDSGFRKDKCYNNIQEAVSGISRLMVGLEDAAEIYCEIVDGKKDSNDPDPLDRSIYFDDINPDKIDKWETWEEYNDNNDVDILDNPIDIMEGCR